ncbi:poly-gamma-glutamate hydrolase family protein [Nonomuraea sp. NPDC050556]|uniref:poly-gamma-glutamate hydrolase family protein n=1 Tax=Nonomuraea sp. NPDC050556 TaxID=3364369 RepID=UPI003794D317
MIRRPLSVLIAAASLTLLLPAAPARAADTYGNYADLAAHEVEGTDYLRLLRFPRGAEAAHIAIHGGAIEPPTTQLADAAARAGHHAFYSFAAIKSSGNRDLHITAAHFDEPKALALVARTDFTVSWHGAAGARPTTYVGGLDKALIRRVRAELRRAGFTVARTLPDGLEGTSPANIVNRNRRGKGVQLEISLGQRRLFFQDGRLDRAWIEDPGHHTRAFAAYIAAVNRALGA